MFNSDTSFSTQYTLREKIEMGLLGQNELASLVDINLGDIKKAQGDKESALKFYTQATDLDPNNVHVWITMGLLYYEIRDFSCSVPCLQKAITIDASNETGYYNLGCIYLEMKLLEQAEDMFKTTLLHNPFHTDALFNLAVVYQNTGRVDEARSCYQKVLLIRPSFKPAEDAIKLI